MSRTISASRIEQLSDISPDQWNRLAGDHPFRRTEWLYSWWQTMVEPDTELFVVAVRDARDRVVGLAPFCVDQSLWRGRVLRFLGSGKTCTDYMGFLIDREYAGEVNQSLVDWFLAAAHGDVGSANRWDRLDLDGVSQSDNAMHAFVARMQPHATVDRHAVESTWRISLPDSWESYLAMLSKRCRRLMRRLDALFVQSGRAEITYYQPSDDLDEWLGDLEKLHTLRRNSLGCDGCFAAKGFREFVRSVSEQLIESGSLRLSRVSIDGKVLASGFGIADGQSYSLYQCGMHPDFADCKPGWLMNQLHLRHAITNGYRLFDFLRGDEAYKARLGAVPIPMQRISLWNEDAVARLRRELWKFKAWRRPAAHVATKDLFEFGLPLSPPVR